MDCTAHPYRDHRTAQLVIECEKLAEKCDAQTKEINRLRLLAMRDRPARMLIISVLIAVVFASSMVWRGCVSFPASRLEACKKTCPKTHRSAVTYDLSNDGNVLRCTCFDQNGGLEKKVVQAP